jgi:hypothetical protein
MKKINVILLFSLILIGSAYAAAGPVPDDYCTPIVTLVNQDPYPATPGDYVKLVFQVSDIDRASCSGIKFKLNTDYPFSLDSTDNGTRVLQNDAFTPEDKTFWLVPFRVRVDKNALERENEIWVQYGSSIMDANHYFKKKFNVTTEDTRTNFEGVIQSTTGSDMTIAIANTGKNVANSMIVRVPEQNDFTATGIDGQMVGNVNAGDYTTVSFQVTQKQGNFVRRNMTSTQIPVSNKKTLQLLISYTDTIGERRNSTIGLPMQVSRGNITSYGRTQSGRTVTTKALIPSWLIAALIIIIIGVLGILLHRNKDGIMNLLRKNGKNNKEIPDWIKRENKKKQ